MSHLVPGDERFHYTDASHRGIAPPDVEQQDWDVLLEVHRETHRKRMANSPSEVAPEDRPVLGVPRPVRPQSGGPAGRRRARP